ncbi:putative ribonuclease H-like domain-containing protein [Tanacetum coccineum]|uniref:Ribonuclease H-like domain-containing protein n=1 Tax=Tanacetum coccineum TaxID=301880 RepID=A0ABQ5HEY8_9ASTR
MSHRSSLRWKPTGKIFKTIGLKWIPTGKIFISSTTKVDSAPQNGSNDDITNQYECKQTFDVSACTLSIHACTSLNPTKEGLRVHSNERHVQASFQKVVPPVERNNNIKQELDLLCSPLHNNRLRVNMIHKDGDGDALFQLKSDLLPHADAQITKTYYKHRDSRIMKAQELKTKTSSQTLIYKIFLQRYQVYQGRLLASFQDDAKYEHRLRIEKYFQVQDYALWDVIENGNSFKLVPQTTTNTDGSSTSLIPDPVTTEEKVQKKNDVKAKSMLLMELPNEHLMTFNQYKDDQTLFASIQTRFGGNKDTKKTLLKQMYENFSAQSTESHDSILTGFRRMNKPDLDTMSFKGTASSSSSSNSQNISFVSSPSSTNEVNTAYRVSTTNTQVSPASTQVSTASTQVSTANLSDDTVYAFLASQLNGSQLVYEDLEQIHEYDIEEMDLKLQLAMLSMRTRRGPRNQDSRNMNQDSSRRTIIVEETSSKSMVAIDGAGLDWSYMADDEFPTNMALIDFSDSEFNKSEFNLATYKRGLASIEEQIVFYKKNELEKLKQEKESNQLKIENFDNASKSLDKLIGSQITDKSRKGVGEFQQPKFEGYGPKTSKSVSEDISNEVRESLDASLTSTTEKPVRKPVKYAEMYRPKAVNTTRPNLAVVNDVRENQGHPQKEDQGYVDSGCSRHMIGNMSYLSDFKEFDRGYVAFGGGAKGGRITSKRTLKIGKLDFEDVYFVKELQFNLFSVSQMCDKKNSVLFTDTGCFVLSPKFKLVDESQVLLKVPKKSNMYSVNMKNIILKESLTCLVAKAILDESILCHRRLGHVNFKTINKLVKDNLVKVVTDDYSRFTWVFFLASKDETSGILKSFITQIENLVDKKVRIIRRNNGTEFKNRVMSEFCEEKSIKREFSVARTPQQNGVAERRNRTLIKAARTMLADFKLPTTFWAKAVNTACKFDGKSNDGFFVGYSLNSKAFIVYNIRTRKVEENLHVRFLEDKSIIAGDGPKWLFDIDVLTKSMNYVLVVAGTNSNDFVDGSLFDSSSKDASNDEPQPSNDAEKKDDKGELMIKK